MSIPGVPKGIRRAVKDAFVAGLETSPLLANGRAVKTWITWDGADKVLGDPPVDAMPAVQIRMLGGPSERIASARAPGQPMKFASKSKISMIVDLWVRGNDAGDLADVADLIYQALAPRDDDARTALNTRFRQAGIKDIELTREILPASAESYSRESIWGQGTYDLTVFFNS